jgi:hypothetical protein
MFDSSKIATIGVIALMIAALTVGVTSSDLVEGFGDLPSFVPRAVPSYAQSACEAQKGNIFSVPPNFQAMGGQRFFSGSLPASITYRMPNQKNMAFRQCSPFTEAVSGCNVQTPLGGSRCSTNSSSCQQLNSFAQSMAPTTHGQHPQVPKTYGHENPTGLLLHSSADVIEGYASAPVQTQQKNRMVLNGVEPSLLPPAQPSCTTGCGVEPVCGPPAENPVVFDRYITANRNSRLRAMGDKIRGDLAIPPCNSGWFQVSVTPSIDLEPGALAVLGGTCNEQGQSIASMVNMSSGGAMTAIAGVDMSNSINTCLVGAGNDVTAIAFP